MRSPTQHNTLPNAAPKRSMRDPAMTRGRIRAGTHVSLAGPFSAGLWLIKGPWSATWQFFWRRINLLRVICTVFVVCHFPSLCFQKYECGKSDPSLCKHPMHKHRWGIFLWFSLIFLVTQHNGRCLGTFCGAQGVLAQVGVKISNAVEMPYCVGLVFFLS